MLLAVENQPNDARSHEMLVQAHDEMKDEEGAVRRILEAAQLNRRNLVFFKDLAVRYDKLRRPEEAERARTNLVEALPNESEGHALLAEIRAVLERL